jgi:hypothetical protein
MELKDNQVKKCDDMLKMQIKECEAAKPSFIKQLGTNIFYIGIGIAIGIVAGL